MIYENENIRREINEAISEEWHKWASGKKKHYIKEQIFKNPEKNQQKSGQGPGTAAL